MPREVALNGVDLGDERAIERSGLPDLKSGLSKS